MLFSQYQHVRQSESERSQDDLRCTHEYFDGDNEWNDHVNANGVASSDKLTAGYHPTLQLPSAPLGILASFSIFFQLQQAETLTPLYETCLAPS